MIYISIKFKLHPLCFRGAKVQNNWMNYYFKSLKIRKSNLHLIRILINRFSFIYVNLYCFEKLT